MQNVSRKIMEEKHAYVYFHQRVLSMWITSLVKKVPELGSTEHWESAVRDVSLHACPCCCAPATLKLHEESQVFKPIRGKLLCRNPAQINQIVPDLLLYSLSTFSPSLYLLQLSS